MKNAYNFVRLNNDRTCINHLRLLGAMVARGPPSCSYELYQTEVGGSSVSSLA